MHSLSRQRAAFFILYLPTRGWNLIFNRPGVYDSIETLSWLKDHSKLFICRSGQCVYTKNVLQYPLYNSWNFRRYIVHIQKHTQNDGTSLLHELDMRKHESLGSKPLATLALRKHNARSHSRQAFFSIAALAASQAVHSSVMRYTHFLCVMFCSFPDLVVAEPAPEHVVWCSVQ